MKFFQKNFVFLHINKLTQRMLTPNTDTLFRFFILKTVDERLVWLALCSFLLSFKLPASM